jgi:hypothetical protein
MNNFAEYITPEKAVKLGMRGFSLSELKEMAKDNSECEVCSLPVWRLVGTGMCFTCTTGEADASDDFELILQN